MNNQQSLIITIKQCTDLLLPHRIPMFPPHPTLSRDLARSFPTGPQSAQFIKQLQLGLDRFDIIILNLDFSSGYCSGRGLASRLGQALPIPMKVHPLFFDFCHIIKLPYLFHANKLGPVALNPSIPIDEPFYVLGSSQSCGLACEVPTFSDIIVTEPSSCDDGAQFLDLGVFLVSAFDRAR